MSKQAIANAVAAILFFIVAFVSFGDSNSGAGTIFIILGAVYLGMALSEKRPPKAK